MSAKTRINRPTTATSRKKGEPTRWFHIATNLQPITDEAGKVRFVKQAKGVSFDRRVQYRG